HEACNVHRRGERQYRDVGAGRIGERVAGDDRVDRFGDNAVAVAVEYVVGDRARSADGDVGAFGPSAHRVVSKGQAAHAARPADRRAVEGVAREYGVRDRHLVGQVNEQSVGLVGRIDDVGIVAAENLHPVDGGAAGRDFHTAGNDAFQTACAV